MLTQHKANTGIACQHNMKCGILTAVTGVGSSPALATCETSQVLLAGVSGGFPGVLPSRPTCRLARLDMSEIILKGTLNRIKNMALWSQRGKCNIRE